MITGAHAIVFTPEANGAEPAGTVSDQGWGLLTAIKVPGGGELGLYEPRHPSPPSP